MLASIDFDQCDQVIDEPEGTCRPPHLAVRVWLKARPSSRSDLHSAWSNHNSKALPGAITTVKQCRVMLHTPWARARSPAPIGALAQVILTTIRSSSNTAIYPDNYITNHDELNNVGFE